MCQKSIAAKRHKLNPILSILYYSIRTISYIIIKITFPFRGVNKSLFVHRHTTSLLMIIHNIGIYVNFRLLENVLLWA